MEIADTTKNGVLVLSVKGRLDASNAGELEDKLLSLIDGGERRVVIDCGHLDYISSAGLRVLLVAAKRLKSDAGQIALAALNEHLREVIEIAGFVAIFAVYGTANDAVAALQ